MEEVERRSRCSIGVICAAISNRYVITTINIDAWIIQDARMYASRQSLYRSACVHTCAYHTRTGLSGWLIKQTRICTHTHTHTSRHGAMSAEISQ